MCAIPRRGCGLHPGRVTAVEPRTEDAGQAVMLDDYRNPVSLGFPSPEPTLVVVLEWGWGAALRTGEPPWAQPYLAASKPGVQLPPPLPWASAVSR